MHACEYMPQLNPRLVVRDPLSCERPNSARANTVELDGGVHAGMHALSPSCGPHRCGQGTCANLHAKPGRGMHACMPLQPCACGMHACRACAEACMHACHTVSSEDPEEAHAASLVPAGQGMRTGKHATPAPGPACMHATTATPRGMPDQVTALARAKHMCMHACRACAGARMHACHTASPNPATCRGKCMHVCPTRLLGGMHACMHACRTAGYEPAGRSECACMQAQPTPGACMHACIPMHANWG